MPTLNLPVNSVVLPSQRQTQPDPLLFAAIPADPKPPVATAQPTLAMPQTPARGGEKKKNQNRSLGTNRISKRHRRFLCDVFALFRFEKIDDFQVVTKAGYEICALLDIDAQKRPIDRLLPNLF